ncbi:uncharacterized protein LOC127848802 isoform X2 [Dreissena polymorpha]|uniref:Uncharacterized protein n=1 Tax=Dreissena polymorpha TaxID=45954 RepID=A0A9D4DR03_DREPO|nr:uncharacterized protein LOC127848802 isoform X2 [Dreissena polymorpha]KAH3752209.1 hypothetical protein DPMN_186822 [Dreissena polymorpha]
MIGDESMEILQRTDGRVRLKPLPLYDKEKVEVYLHHTQRDAMFSYNLRELVLPPIDGDKAFSVTRDDRLAERTGIGSRSARVRRGRRTSRKRSSTTPSTSSACPSSARS